MSEEQLRDMWVKQCHAAHAVLDGTDLPLPTGPLDVRVKVLLNVAKEATGRLMAAEAARDENDVAWQGARDRASRLQAERDTAIRERAEMATERDNCREVLRKEREDRASQTATMGQALASLRAEVNTLGETVENMTAENARLTSQLEVVERILTSALRGAK